MNETPSIFTINNPTAENNSTPKPIQAPVLNLPMLNLNVFIVLVSVELYMNDFCSLILRPRVTKVNK